MILKNTRCIGWLTAQYYYYLVEASNIRRGRRPNQILSWRDLITVILRGKPADDLPDPPPPPPHTHTHTHTHHPSAIF